jgi:RNA polymerase sigma factor (sigma-70 family)
MRSTPVRPAYETARLYEEYSRELYRFCLGRLRSPEDAEDAVQNTFIRVHQALQKGVVPHHPTAWLYQIAANVCLSRRDLTRRRAQWQAPPEAEVGEVAAPEIDADAARELMTALSAMPANLRHAILLREWQGLSYAEIADSMHKTVPAVETLIHRARRHLARALAPVRRALVELPLGLGRLVSLAHGAGPAPLAAGAAALALGGAVVGADVGRADTHRPPPTRSSPELVADAAPVQVAQAPPHAAPRRLAAAKLVGGRAARSKHPAPARGSSPARARTPVPPATTAAATPATAEPPTPAPATTTTSAPAPRPAPARVTTPSVGVVPSLSLAAPPVELPPTPVELPPPPVTVPTVTATVPGVTVPAVPVPAPTATIPSVTLPLP